jgi:hypothetical protein
MTRSVRWLLALVAVWGCDESESVHGTPAEGAAEAPSKAEMELAPNEPSAPTLEGSRIVDASSYVERHSGLPEGLECPGREVCVTEHESAVWVLKRGWGHHYRLDYGSAAAAVRPGGVLRAQWSIRVAAGVAYALAEERTPEALGHCGLAAMMPELYQGGGLVVDVPASEQTSARPQPVLPVVANAHLRSEYAFIDIERAESMVWFTDAEVQRMTKASFEEPRVRQVSGRRIVDGYHRSLDLLVVYSPESENVYVLERTREVPEDEHQAQRDERLRTDEQEHVDFIRSLGIRRVIYDAEAACEIPAEFGGQEWMPLRSR